MSSASFPEALAYLYDLQKYGIKFGLSSTARLLERLGNPHLPLKAVHIAGTNGKGSTSAMISSILVRAGYRVGLYTSPHLVRFNERYRINDRDLGDGALLESFRRVRAVVDDREPPTFFEMTTAMAFTLFAEERVDWAVLEVGMGGRLDATNVVLPQVTVITNISLEHQEFLGSTIAAIAREKAGIIKAKVPLVTAVTQPAALAVIKACCVREQAPWYRVGQHLRVRSQGARRFSYHGLNWHLRDLRTPLSGRHQLVNAASALGALELLAGQGNCGLSPDQIREGLIRTRWPGRLEWLSRRPPIVLDGAHNLAGAMVLKRALREEFTYDRLILVLGIMADKDIRGMIAILAPLAEHIILTRPRYERAAAPEVLLEAGERFRRRTEVIERVEGALVRAKELARPSDLVVVTGSLYFIGEVKEISERHDEARHG
ncbi:MAG TPA: folylpolyglutamate synthase/dihydrofolate synthase family protein [Syntrophobacteria bacterium]|nr:folylpolyglutamate synthase/dihydrofolate synthase family protein [Syntrophobacteria bacterium]